jgi:hypothetical protein
MTMRITIDRSGGFANIPLHREVDTSTLPPAEAAAIEKLADAAMKAPSSAKPMPDAYNYEITIDGKKHAMTEPAGAWAELIGHIS